MPSKAILGVLSRGVEGKEITQMEWKRSGSFNEREREREGKIHYAESNT